MSNISEYCVNIYSSVRTVLVTNVLILYSNKATVLVSIYTEMSSVSEYCVSIYTKKREQF